MALWPHSVAAKDAPPSKGGCTQGTRSALEELGCEIATYIGTLADGPVLVATGMIEADRTPERPEELATRIAKVVAGRLGPKAQFARGSLKLGAARAAAQSAGRLLYVTPRIARGLVTATFDLYPVPNGFWDRVRTTSPNPTQHGFVERRLDPELMSFFPPVPLVSKHIDRATAQAPAVALACGNIDGKGTALVWVDRHRVSIARIRQQRLAPSRTANWGALSGVAPAPLREPIGTAAVGDSGLWIGLTDRREGLRLGPDLRIQERIAHRIPWPGVGCLSTDATALGGGEPCGAGDARPLLARVTKPVDAVAGARVVDETGLGRQLLAWRDAATGVTHVQDDRGRAAEVEGSGAQLALGDLDRDGQPELLTSADTLDPAGDALIVRTWQHDGRLVERFRLAVPAGVHALAVCPGDDSGLTPVAIGTGDGVWVVR